MYHLLDRYVKYREVKLIIIIGRINDILLTMSITKVESADQLNTLRKEVLGDVDSFQKQLISFLRQLNKDTEISVFYVDTRTVEHGRIAFVDEDDIIELVEELIHYDFRKRDDGLPDTIEEIESVMESNRMTMDECLFDIYIEKYHLLSEIEGFEQAFKQYRYIDSIYDIVGNSELNLDDINYRFVIAATSVLHHTINQKEMDGKAYIVLRDKYVYN